MLLWTCVTLGQTNLWSKQTKGCTWNFHDCSLEDNPENGVIPPGMYMKSGFHHSQEDNIFRVHPGWHLPPLCWYLYMGSQTLGFTPRANGQLQNARTGLHTARPQLAGYVFTQFLCLLGLKIKILWVLNASILCLRRGGAFRQRFRF